MAGLPSPPGPVRARRIAVAALAVFATVRVGSTAVAAHGSGWGGQYAVGLPVALGLIVGAGLVAGVLAARGPPLRDRVPPATVGRTVGTLLVGIGGLAVLSALTRRPAVGLAGVVAGAAGGGAAVRYGGCGVCADATVGTVAVHRLVEGVTLAAAYAAGSAVGAAGAVVLACHTVAECVAVGGNPAFGQRRAIGAVLVIEAVFVGGVVLGVVGAVGIPAVSRLAVLSVVGGMLAVLGADEFRSAHGSAPPTPSAA